MHSPAMGRDGGIEFEYRKAAMVAASGNHGSGQAHRLDQRWRPNRDRWRPDIFRGNC